ASMPLAAAYTASKQAIEGFTGSLAHELAAFGVRAKLVEPGYAPTTRFAANTDVPVMDLIPEAYLDFARPIFAGFANPPLTTKESDVAAAIWLAVNDGSDRLHYPAGEDAVALAGLA
ncbi:SDR family NAD(P)-dependent oxidoreductase, partial [Rhizobium leguminosarum]